MPIKHCASRFRQMNRSSAQCPKLGKCPWLGQGRKRGAPGGIYMPDMNIPQGIKRFTCTGVIPARQPSNLAYRHVWCVGEGRDGPQSSPVQSARPFFSIPSKKE